MILVVALIGTSFMLVALGMALESDDAVGFALMLSAASALPGTLAALVVSRDLRRRLLALFSAGLKKAQGLSS